MIVQKEFLKRLKEDFKLNIYEVKIWTSLLSKGIAAAGELGDISGVPRSRCYDVLESLEKKGFIIVKIGRPIKYIAVQPEEIIERVKKGIRKDTEVNLGILDNIKATDVFNELELLHKTGIEMVDSETLTDVITGKHNIHSFIKKNLDRAKKSVIITTTKEHFDREMKLLKNTLKNLSRRGVNIKIVAPVEQAVEGLKVTSTDLNSRMVIFDKKEVLFMLTNEKDNANDTGIWIKSQMFSNIIVDMLDGYIKK